MTYYIIVCRPREGVRVSRSRDFGQSIWRL